MASGGLFKTPEELRKMGWMPQDEASKLLGLPQGEMISWDYIDSEQRASDGENWVLLLPGVQASRQSGDQKGQATTDQRFPDSDSNAECKVSNAKCKTENGKRKKRRNDPVDPSLFPQRERIPSSRSRWGEKPVLISVEEAAGRTGWSVGYLKRQLGNFVEAAWEGGERRVVLQWVEWFLAARAEERTWKAGERERKRNAKALESGVQEEETTDDGRSTTDVEQPSWIPEWITCTEAASLLQVTPVHIHQLARQGKLPTKMGSREGKPWTGRAGKVCRLVLHSAVRAREEMKERTRRRGSKTPEQWKYDLRHPVVRTKMEPGIGDRLISRREAASILGIQEASLSKLICRGIVFAWQKDPGKRGSRTFFSERQVVRVSQRPERLKYFQTRRMSNDQCSMSNPDNERRWEEKGIVADPWSARSGWAERDHGEYYSTRQVGILLGVCRGTVDSYREGGRLKGYRLPWKVGKYERRRWWFFKKEDVHALMNDPEYIRNRTKYRRSQTPEAKSERLRKWFQEPPYVPHGPNPYWERKRRIELAAREAAAWLSEP